MRIDDHRERFGTASDEPREEPFRRVVIVRYWISRSPALNSSRSLTMLYRSNTARLLSACGESHFADPIPRRVSAANQPIERKVDRERAKTLRTTASVLNDPIPRG